jgi:hypothetical protein
MISRDDILSAAEKELDDLLTDAHLSETTLKTIKAESTGSTQRVLYALTTEELQSAGAFEQFMQTTLAEARMKMHMR